jgi:low-affinity ferrous iron transport protein
MRWFIEALRSPGAKAAVQDRAPMPQVSASQLDNTDEKKTKKTRCVNDGGFSPIHKRRLDRWLDWLVRASGSEPVFIIVLAALLAWALAGIRFGNSTDWAVVISDVQAILCYIFDSLLMRQQLNGHDALLHVSAILRSRNSSHKRMLRDINQQGQYKAITTAQQSNDLAEFDEELPGENWLGRVSTAASNILGHFATICIFWAGIFVWLGFGPYCGWSDWVSVSFQY